MMRMMMRNRKSECSGFHVCFEEVCHLDRMPQDTQPLSTRRFLEVMATAADEEDWEACETNRTGAWRGGYCC